jgi:hypothetical protein
MRIGTGSPLRRFAKSVPVHSNLMVDSGGVPRLGWRQDHQTIQMHHVGEGALLSPHQFHLLLLRMNGIRRNSV